MIIVKKEVILHSSIEKVWDLITNLDNQSWRKDIQKIEHIDSHRFKEHDNSGYQTEFYIVNKQENQIYEMNINNENLKGHWIGKLKEQEDGTVFLEMTEAIQVKKASMKLFAKLYLKKQQKQYIIDLKKALNAK